MEEFNYLTEKIKDAQIIFHPFPHYTIERFFKPEHFEKIIKSKHIQVDSQKTTRDLIESLLKAGYQPQEFPGWITDLEEYISFVDEKKEFNKELIEGYGREVISGYGVTMRLKEYNDGFLNTLVEYFIGDQFQSAIKEKYQIYDEVIIETAIQKNLTCYEISPHCDTSLKALTYMINIYTDMKQEDLSIHTHLLEFIPRYKYLYEFWKHNRDIDPVWVPWDWCKTVKKTSKNNSICIFKPDFDTLHAVKLNFDHSSHQRNQIYGNLWYKEAKATKSIPWQKLDLFRNPNLENLGIKHHLKHTIKAIKNRVF